MLIFNDKHIVDWIKLNDVVSAMRYCASKNTMSFAGHTDSSRFGRFGREDAALVLVTVGGILSVKILKRTAQFERVESASGASSVIKVWRKTIEI